MIFQPIGHKTLATHVPGNLPVTIEVGVPSPVGGFLSYLPRQLLGFIL